MKSLRFGWDENKNTINKKKHKGISFEEAQTVFLDPNAHLISDPDHSEDEDRFILLGMSEATKLEMRTYEEYLKLEKNMISQVQKRIPTLNG